MQQCAQCSKTASSSAHRALAGLNNYWEWIPSWIENTASTSSSSSRSKAVKHHTRAYTHSPANDASPGLGAAGFGSFHHFTDEVDRNIKNQRDSQGSPDRSSSSRINRNGSHRSVRYRTSQHEPRDNRRAFSTSANPQEQLQKHDTSDNITPHKSTKEEISVTQAKFRTDDTSSSNASSWEDQSSAPSRIEPTKNSSKETSKGSGTGLKHLTEEVVHSTEEDGGNGSSNKKSDTIHKLLAYPTLYDPIRKPRNRLVLCHGLYGFDTWGLDLLPTLRVHYWADVLQVLKGVVGVEPIVVGVSGTGAIKNRAQELHKVLQKDERLAGKEVNLIGHSMGGLDCRHLLTHIKPTEYHPVSLTTLATPHRGSPFMSWCRANIGIGDLAKAAAEATQPGASTTAKADIDLPYSLKTPIFSRSKWQADKDAERSQKNKKEQEDRDAREQTRAAAAQAAVDAKGDSVLSKAAAVTKTVINLPGLNFSLGSPLASYLLDFIDSPAYSNLTPDFLENIFNPNTPDRPDIRYFSVAARTNKVSVAHALWLPKLVVDKAQELERSKDAQLGRTRSPDWQWGNDCLVPVESAKWGEFLGVLDGADHWSIRGGAGFATEPKSKKKPQTTTPDADKKSVVEKPSTASAADKSTMNGIEAETEEGRLEKIAEQAKAALSSVADIAGPIGDKASSVVPAALSSLTWSDINSAVFKGISALDEPSSSTVQKPNGQGWSVAASPPSAGTPLVADMTRDTKETKSPPSTTNGNKDALRTLANLASWVVKRIPLPSGNNRQLKSSIDPAFPLDDAEKQVADAKDAADSSTYGSASKSEVKDTSKSTISNTARLLFGSSSPSSAKKSNGKSANNDADKFNHERFYVALCKKLYDEGM